MSGDAAVQATLRAAHASHRAGDTARARRAYDEVLRARPDQPAALHGLGVLALQTRENDTAAALFSRLVAVRPKDAAARNFLGLALMRLGRFADAEKALRRAVTLDNRHADAWSNLGAARHELRRLAEAEQALKAALRVNPRHVLALNNLGMVYRDARRHDEAAVAYRKALALDPDNPALHANLGNALHEAHEFGPAAEAYRRALALRPEDGQSLSQLAWIEARRCRWDALPALQANLRDRVGAGAADLVPMHLLELDTSPGEQLRATRAFCAAKYGGIVPLPSDPAAGPPKRLTVGYISPDFREHPVGHLIPGLIEGHDRSSVRVLGYSLRPDDGSDVRRRLEAAFDGFADLYALPAAAAAERIRADGVDVLVDLAGHTRDARMEVLAHRPAPVQVLYLGYAGTSGAPFVDYVVGDAVVTPPERAGDYTEQIVRLPGCFLVADPGRAPRVDPPDRTDCGLPQAGFVFCAFNRPDKISSATFGLWMRILARVPDAVLWLRVGEEEVADRLRREAEGRDVDPARLRFAGRVPRAEDHLARQAHAGLFLDTLPYNAHATALDAILAGVPMLTRPGATFAGRVGASLMTSLGCPELVAEDPDTYVETAVALATNPERLADLRARVKAARGPGTPFDPAAVARHLEAAFAAMWERHAAGLPPAPIDVPRSDR